MEVLEQYKARQRFLDSLQVGQEIEARFTNNHNQFVFPAKIVKINKGTLRVETLVEGINGWPKGKVFVIDKDKSAANGVYSLNR